MATAIPPKAPTTILSRLFSRSRNGAGEELVGPIRGEVLGAERLGERARAVARGHHLLPAQKQRGVGPLLLRLEDTRSVLDRVYQELNTGAERGLDISPAGEWLLDNFYTVEEHIREIRATLPNGYYRELPELATGPLARFPRVYEIAIELIAHTEGHLDLANTDLFVREFQRVTAPHRRAVGDSRRCSGSASSRTSAGWRCESLRGSTKCETADAAAERSCAKRARRRQQALAAALHDFVDHHPKLSAIFVARFLQQIRAYQATFTPLVWLEQWIAEDGPSAEEAVARTNQRAALTHVTIANSITSLRTIARLDWNDFVESQSVTEQMLRGIRAGTTRDDVRDARPLSPRGRAHRQADQARRRGGGARIAVALASDRPTPS